MYRHLIALLLVLNAAGTLRADVSVPVAESGEIDQPARPVGPLAKLLVEDRRIKTGLLRVMALPLLVLLGIKTALSLPILFGIVALAAFKGMWSGGGALIVAGALALRNLLQPHKIIQFPQGHHFAEFKRQDYPMDQYGYYSPY